MKFQVERESGGVSRARAGVMETRRGRVPTPVFMPVGTQGAVRGQTRETLLRSGSQVLLANTYHLWLKPGVDVLKRFGGIHRFTGWDGPVLTDSGGYQIFSLAHRLELSEQGASFLPHPDRPRVLLTPELSQEIQAAIGSDIRMVLDECVPSTCDRDRARGALERTTRWAERSLRAHVGKAGLAPADDSALFAIVQGACFPDLRRASARALTSMGFDGYAVGGLAVGESREERESMTAETTAHLPKDRPRYLMGVGTPIDLLEAVHRGVDLFDCILPTAFAQQGAAFTSRGRVDLRRGAYRLSEAALDPGCSCPTCATHSRAFLHHLIKAREVLGWQLVGEHNLHFYHHLMREMREAILEDRFESYHREHQAVLAATDVDHPIQPPSRGRPRRPRPTSLGRHEILRGEDGAGSIRDLRSGEVMHSTVGAEQESRALYVEQSRLAERLKLEALVLWDVGLGAAANAMASIRAAQAVHAGDPAARELHVVSFENDLDALKLALGHPELFRTLNHAAPRALLEQGEWRSRDGRIRWTLLEGDFRARMADAPQPELVFYDPFSTRTDAELWTYPAFEALFGRMGASPAELYTFSASTAVRGALLASGFYVRPGVGTGIRPETTVAVTPARAAELAGTWLGADWLGRWTRSTARDPAIDARIRAHPQFARAEDRAKAESPYYTTPV
jgi:queuine tRNA-ribosyltransferase